MTRPDTRERILDAAFETLRTRGYAGTSSRAIAAAGSFNPALIFYYFGSVDELLVATLDRASAERLERYRPDIEAAASPAELLEVLRRIYADDLASGHIRVVSELVAAGVANAELGARVAALLQPWVAIAEDAVTRGAAGSPLIDLVAPRELALAAVTFYLGANLLTHLLRESAEIDGLIAAAARVAALLAPP
jgi:AcrR family transcriptional regulator